MPLYEYQCESCAKRFERIQKFSDPPVETCPSCGGRVKKLLSSPAIQFKGSGWYITDYAKKHTEKTSGEKTSAESSTAKADGSTTSSDSGTSSPASTSTTPASDSAKKAKE
jgi:putative FmdB family regulatory protein